MLRMYKRVLNNMLTEPRQMFVLLRLLFDLDSKYGDLLLFPRLPTRRNMSVSPSTSHTVLSKLS